MNLRTFIALCPGWDVGRSMMFMGEYYRYYLTAVFTGTAISFTLISIFLYKRRSAQMLLCWFAILFIVAAQGYVYYEYQTRVFPIGDVVLRKWNLLSVVAIVFEILAFVYIRKDEETIKSLDRLRD